MQDLSLGSRGPFVPSFLRRLRSSLDEKSRRPGSSPASAHHHLAYDQALRNFLVCKLRSLL